MQQPGFFCWHVHHEKLLEWCYGYDERAEHIRTEKALDEQGLRLRLFQPVMGKLPQEVVETQKAYGEAQKAYVEAQDAYFGAWDAHDEALDWTAFLKVWKKKAFREAKKVYEEASDAYTEARNTYTEARNTYFDALSNHKSEIEELHKQECLDCPWDGWTIFPAA